VIASIALVVVVGLGILMSALYFGHGVAGSGKGRSTIEIKDLPPPTVTTGK
jgi:hypothetical protein